MGNNISYQTAEYGKFLQLGGNTAFPPISVVRWSYPDTSSAFPSNSGLGPLSSVDVYPKYAVLTHLTNADDIKISLSAENINVSLDDLEDLTRLQNSISLLLSYQLSGLSTYVDDLEKNTYDTASACDDTYHETVKLNERLGDSPLFDAFGRFRTSQPTTLIDAKHLYNKLPNVFDEALSGNASSSFVKNDSLVLMSTTSTNDYVIRQSWNHFNYEPGKSLQAFFTFVAPKQLDSVKRIGLFQSLSAAPYEPSDGIFLEINGNNVYFKMVKNEGTPHVMTFPQSAWNVDKFDGTGISGLTIDFSKSQIFTIDYEWLGVGRARLGFVFNGQIHYAHYENHYNNIEAPYLTSPNQPIRYEIRQTGAGGAGAILKHICSTVIVEGGETGAGQSITVATSAAVAIDSTSYKPIIFLRSNPNAHDATSYIKHLDFINLDQYAVHFVLMSLKNSDLVNALNWTNADSSSMQYAIGNSQSINLSAGVNIYGGYISGSGQNKVTTESSLNIPEKIAQFGIGINGREEVLAIVGKSFGGNTTVLGVVNMIERT